MQQRRVRLGDILDDYCPRERRITNHAVVAMIDDEVKQTRCTTCDADHEYKSAKVPPPRRRKGGALAGEDSEGVIRPRAAVSDAEESEPLDEPESDESLDTVPDVDAQSAAAPDGVAEVEAEGEEPAGEDRDEWPVHRPLIRATLPRPEGQTPERKPTDFTMRPGGTGRGFETNRNGKRQRGHRPMRQGQGGQGQPSGQGQSRFGSSRSGPGQGPRQGSGPGGPQGQRHGNRPGPSGGGGRPGPGRRGPGSGPGRKRGR